MKLLTERDVCERIGIALSTLRKWRLLKKGPTFVKFGTAACASVRYPETALEEYVNHHIKYDQTNKLKKEATRIDQEEAMAIAAKKAREEEAEKKRRESFDYYV